MRGRTPWYREVSWFAALTVLCVVSSLGVLILTPYAAFGIGLGLAAVAFGLLANRD